ncbi:hypothetical protein NMY22_g16467 [Coprinellus aureogranulatus]|nr:hypothetical protein NMY22_g16467 [Coprinellus aureogranulatus]
MYTEIIPTSDPTEVELELPPSLDLDFRTNQAGRLSTSHQQTMWSLAPLAPVLPTTPTLVSGTIINPPEYLSVDIPDSSLQPQVSNNGPECLRTPRRVTLRVGNRLRRLPEDHPLVTGIEESPSSARKRTTRTMIADILHQNRDMAQRLQRQEAALLRLNALLELEV